MPRINLAKLVTLNQGMEGKGELGSGGCGWHAGTKVSFAPAKIPGELRHCGAPRRRWTTPSPAHRPPQNW